MFKEKKSFLERLSGIVNNAPEEDFFGEEEKVSVGDNVEDKDNWIQEENNEGELTIDMCQTPKEIIIHTMIAGVKPEDLEVSINREMVTIKGKREREKNISDENYFYKELYWGSFSRTILLPQEVEPDEAEAIEKNGLLTIRLPKIDKEKIQQLKIKSK